MTQTIRTTAADRFSSFDVHRTLYKQIGKSSISVGLLIPKDIKPGKHPLHVKYHGGGLITGDALFPDWFANYLVSSTHRTSSIMVLPNYRFVPEHSGADILEDIRDFWTWVDHHLVNFLQGVAPGIEVDLDRLLVSGDSSGGWLALHSVFELPEGRIKALFLEYPMAKKWCKTKEWLEERGKPAPGEEVIEKHLVQLAEGSVVYSAIPGDPARDTLAYAFSASQRYWDRAFGTDSKLHPIERLGERKQFPPSLILHGDADTAVDLKDSEDFVQRIGQVMGPLVADEVHLVVRKGEEHGFDIDIVEEEVLWLAKELQWLEKVWLR